MLEVEQWTREQAVFLHPQSARWVLPFVAGTLGKPFGV